MNVIFLDFDGVINNFNNFDGVDFNNVKWLLEIVKESNAKIVATTSNKYSFQRNSGVDYQNTLYFKMVSLLEKMGIEIFDVTPYVYGDRKSEIIEYIRNHKEIQNFLILDDEFISDSLKEHQVLLDLYNGICEEHVKPSLDILNGKLGFYPESYNFDESPEDRMIRIHEYHSRNK